MRRVVAFVVAASALIFVAAAEERSTVAVPRLAETSLKRAVVLLHRAGLRVTVPAMFYLASNSTPMVVRQNPAGGAFAAAGTPVILGLAQPPTVAPTASARSIRVPRLTGLSLTRAVARLEHVGLTYWTVERARPLHRRDVRRLFDAYVARTQRPAAGRIFLERRQVDGEERISPVALSVRTAPRRR
jgi:beta-lactam-binding protein with PASTA domain